MATISTTPAWQRSLVVLTGTVVSLVVVGCLYWAQTVFIPVALAVFLTFLLAPLVSLVQQRGLRRTPAVILVVLLASLVLLSFVGLVMMEVQSVARDLPEYTKNIKGKIKSFEEMAEGTAGIGKIIKDVRRAANLDLPASRLA